MDRRLTTDNQLDLETGGDVKWLSRKPTKTGVAPSGESGGVIDRKSHRYSGNGPLRDTDYKYDIMDYLREF